MEDVALRNLIADSIEQAEAEEREAKRLAEADQIEFDRLMKDAAAARLAEVGDIPQALIPYCLAASSRWAGDVDALKRGWRPEDFIARAPGLPDLHFAIQTYRETGRCVTRSISFTGAGGTFDKWYLALAAAARFQRDLSEPY